MNTFMLVYSIEHFILYQSNLITLVNNVFMTHLTCLQVRTMQCRREDHDDKQLSMKEYFQNVVT